MHFDTLLKHHHARIPYEPRKQTAQTFPSTAIKYPSFYRCYIVYFVIVAMETIRYWEVKQAVLEEIGRQTQHIVDMEAWVLAWLRDSGPNSCFDLLLLVLRNC